MSITQEFINYFCPYEINTNWKIYEAHHNVIAKYSLNMETESVIKQWSIRNLTFQHAILSITTRRIFSRGEY